jgi:hypothetical protein
VRRRVSRPARTWPNWTHDIRQDEAHRPSCPCEAPLLAAMRFEFRAGLGQVNESREVFVRRYARWMEEQLYRQVSWTCWVWVSDIDRGELWAELIGKVPNPIAEPEQHAC